MLEELLSGLKNDALGTINNHPDIPNEKLDDIMDVIGNVTKEHVAKESTNSGGLDNLMNLFSDNENNQQANSLQNNMMNSVIDGLMKKTGLGKSGASAAASAILPMVLKSVTEKNSSTPANDASPLADIFGSVLSAGKDSADSSLLGGLGKLFE